MHFFGSVDVLLHNTNYYTLVSDPKSGILGLFSFFRGQIKNKAGFYVFLDVHARKLKKWATENIGQ